MKTYDELLASGSHTEIMAVVTTNTKRMDALFAEAKKRPDGAPTKEEMEEINRLDTETETLQAKAAELKKTDDIRLKNARRLADLNEPDYKIPFPGKSKDDTKSEGIVSFPFAGSLKHINFGTRTENAEHAYRFYKWFAATTLKHQAAFDWCKEHDIPLRFENGAEIKTVNEGNNNQGGALVPPEFDATLIRLIETYGVFRRFAMISSMTRETKTQPRRTGGMTAYWVKEAGSITASNPTYDNVDLVAKKLAALAAMSSEIDEDSALSIADQLAFEIAYAFALSEDQAGFIGDGSSTYGGITGVTQKLKGLSGTIANIAGLWVGTGNAYSELLLTDFNNTLALLPQYADTPNAGWFVHKGFYHSVMQKLELAAGGVTAMEISQGDRRPRPLFLGYPVNFCQVMPRTEANSQVCALLGDMSLAATFGDRRARTIATDPYSLFSTDMIQVRGIERIDINIHDVGNASGTASLRVPGPICGLILAAS